MVSYSLLSFPKKLTVETLDVSFKIPSIQRDLLVIQRYLGDDLRYPPMALENANSINQLNESYPSGTDRLRDGDDHIRLLKRVLKKVFGSLNGDLEVTAEYINGLPGKELPVGVIMPFAGNPSNLPPIWALCDGRVANLSDGSGTIQTPDMRGRVVIGASTDLPLGTLSGQSTRTVTTEAAGAHTHTGTTEPAGAHTHMGGATVGSATTGITVNAPIVRLENEQRQANAVTSVTINDPGHTHPISQAPTSEAGAHAHNFATGSSGAHGHSVTVDVMQPSVALNWIMRV